MAIQRSPTPSSRYFRYIRAASQQSGILAATATRIVFDGIVQTSPEVSYSAGGVATLQKSGVWLIQAMVLLDAAAGSRASVQAYINNGASGQIYYLGDIHGSHGADQYGPSGSIALPLKAGDTVDIRVLSSVATVAYNSSSYTYFNLFRLG
jgi:hypothetical protein